MPTIVKGHGQREDDIDTFVPTGCTVKMYSDYDVDLATSSALVAIASGQFGAPNDEATEGKPIANYTLYTQDDRFYAQWYAMGAQASTPIKWVGGDLDDGIRLCNLDGTCSADTGTHDCTGVLGTVHDAQIILLACRGVMGAAGGAPTAGYGSDSEDPLHDVNADLDDWMRDFIGRAGADPAAAEREFDALPQGTQALVLARGYGEAFSYGRWVRTFCDADDLDGLFNHLRQNTGKAANIEWLLTSVAPYGAALDSAAGRHPAAFKDFLAEVGDPWRAAFNQRPGFVAALSAISAAEAHTIPWEDFVELNTTFVKNMAEGDGAVFWQHGDTLVIGGGYRRPYGQMMLDAGGVEGTLTMSARGGTFNRGGVEVSGPVDQSAFKRSFARLSSKSVTFA